LAECRAGLAECRAGLAECRAGLAECRAGSLAGFPAGALVADYRVECLVRAPAWPAILADCRHKPRAACPANCPDRLPAGFRAKPPATPADSRVSSSLDRPPAWVAAPAAPFPELKDRWRQGRRRAVRARCRPRRPVSPDRWPRQVLPVARSRTARCRWSSRWLLDADGMKDWWTSRPARRTHHGQAWPEEARPQAQQGQSRQAAERINTNEGADRPTGGPRLRLSRLRCG
jgi:hypothetical protein